MPPVSKPLLPPKKITAKKMHVDDFKKNFVGFEITTELISLHSFLKKNPGSISRRLKLIQDGQARISNNYLLKQVFDFRVLPFAEADNNGALYAFWDDQGPERNLNDFPIILILPGNKFHLVAENIFLFLILQSFDRKPVIKHYRLSFEKQNENPIPSKNMEAYNTWLGECMHLNRNISPSKILARVRIKHGYLFNSWRKFCTMKYKSMIK